MGVPLLYPWANRLAGFQYEAAGRSVEVPHDPSRIALDNNGLPIHGVIGARLPWEVVHEPDAGARSLAARVVLERGAAAAVRGVPVPPRPRIRGAPAGAALGDRRERSRVRARTPCRWLSAFTPTSHRPAAIAREWLVELPAMRHLALDAAQIPTGPEESLAAERFELAAREFDDGFDSVGEPARFAVSDGSPADRAGVPGGLPVRAGVRAADGTFHLLRADDRAGERAAKRRGPGAAGAG